MISSGQTSALNGMALETSTWSSCEPAFLALSPQVKKVAESQAFRFAAPPAEAKAGKVLAAISRNRLSMHNTASTRCSILSLRGISLASPPEIAWYLDIEVACNNEVHPLKFWTTQHSSQLVDGLREF
jgi:hypothetical protein